MDRTKMPMLDHKEFEYFMVDYAKIVLKKDAQKYGHNGEAQNGVDIVIYNKDKVITEAIQCKNYINSNKINKRFIENCISEADAFVPAIQKLYFAFAFECTTKLIKFCNEINQLRSQQGKFLVEFIFWDEISSNVYNKRYFIKKYYKPLYDEIFDTICSKPYSRKDINTDIEYQMFKEFNTIFEECKVVKFVESNPNIGIEIDIIDKIDVFHIKTKDLLDKYIFYCKSEVYDYVAHIYYCINSLNYLYAINMELNEWGTHYQFIQKPYKSDFFKEVFNDSRKVINRHLRWYIYKLSNYIKIILQIQRDN